MLLMYFIVIIIPFFFNHTHSVRQVVLTCGNDDNGGDIKRGLPGGPGKRGPEGPPGARGVRGVRGVRGKPGRSDTWEEAFFRLQERVQQLENRFNATDCLMSYNNGFTASGVQHIYTNEVLTSVYCDHETDGPGWMVIQTRFDGSQDFYQNYDNYVKGFGNITEEHWIGLENLHLMTNARSFKLRVDIEDWQNNRRYATYSTFSIGNSQSFYNLTVEGYIGNAGDSLGYHNGQPFTTFDSNHDSSSSNCAVTYHGAWWYKDCYHSNLNGEYLHVQTFTPQAMNWNSWLGSTNSLKKVKMMIRPN